MIYFGTLKKEKLKRQLEKEKNIPFENLLQTLQRNQNKNYKSREMVSINYDFCHANLRLLSRMMLMCKFD